MAPQLPCALCQQPMAVVQHGAIHIDRCACGSIWFDAGELATWRRGAPTRGTADTIGAATRLRCPHCDVALRRYTLDGAEVLPCPNCRGRFLPAASVVALQPESTRENTSAWGFADLFEVILEGIAWIDFT
jgi:Zn-finger nucleic acid-binding protein